MKRIKVLTSRLLVCLIGATLIGLSCLTNAAYLLPPNPLTKSVKIPVNAFMDKYFGQAWTLFAPNPAFSSTKLIVRCSGESEWFDPLESLLATHYKNRFSISSLLVKQYKFIATELRSEIGKRSAKFCNEATYCLEASTEVLSSDAFAVASSFARSLCGNLSGESRKRVEFRILDIFPRSYADRDNVEEISSIVEFEFLAQTFQRSMK